MEQTDKIHTDRRNQHADNLNNTITDSFENFLENIDYFTFFGFLLSRFAYELVHEKRMSD